MPEIAEVALTAEILHCQMKDKVLEKIRFVDGRYKRDPPEGLRSFRKALPLTIKSVKSKGKFLWFHLVGEEDWYLWNTFGLTGGWTFNDDTRFIKCELVTDDLTARYYDQRNFGTFKISQNKRELDRKLKTLTPDLLKEEFDFQKVTQYEKPIVSILMDQKKVGSGIGNYLAAEILYRAKISPYRLGTEMSRSQLKRLVYWTKYVIKLSYIDNRTDYVQGLTRNLGKCRRKEYHPEIELSEDDHFQFQVYGQEVDPKGNPVEQAKIIKGRTTWWVPRVQK